MITFEEAKIKAQSRRVLIDTAKIYEDAYVFSYSKGFSLTETDDVVVLKDSGDVYCKGQIKEKDLGDLITIKEL